jgi:hypothetical protein
MSIIKVKLRRWHKMAVFYLSAFLLIIAYIAWILDERKKGKRIDRLNYDVNLMRYKLFSSQDLYQYSSLAVNRTVTGKRITRPLRNKKRKGVKTND